MLNFLADNLIFVASTFAIIGIVWGASALQSPPATPNEASSVPAATTPEETANTPPPAAVSTPPSAPPPSTTTTPTVPQPRFIENEEGIDD